MHCDSWHSEAHIEHTDREAVAIFLSTCTAIDHSFNLATTSKRTIITHLRCPSDSISVPLPYADFTCEQNENSINFINIMKILWTSNNGQSWAYFSCFYYFCYMFLSFFLSFFLSSYCCDSNMRSFFNAIASHITYFNPNVSFRTGLAMFLL